MKDIKKIYETTVTQVPQMDENGNPTNVFTLTQLANIYGIMKPLLNAEELEKFNNLSTEDQMKYLTGFGMNITEWQKAKYAANHPEDQDEQNGMPGQQPDDGLDHWQPVKISNKPQQQGQDDHNNKIYPDIEEQIKQAEEARKKAEEEAANKNEQQSDSRDPQDIADNAMDIANSAQQMANAAQSAADQAQNAADAADKNAQSSGKQSDIKNADKSQVAADAAQDAADQAQDAANRAKELAQEAQDAAERGDKQEAARKAKEAYDAAKEAANKTKAAQMNAKDALSASKQTAQNQPGQNGQGQSDSDINNMSAQDAANAAQQSATNAQNQANQAQAAADAAQEKADASGSSADQAKADAAQQAADNAQSAADQAQAAADAAQQAADNGNASSAQQQAKNARDAANSAQQSSQSAQQNAGQSGQQSGQSGQSGQQSGQESGQSGSSQQSKGQSGPGMGSWDGQQRPNPSMHNDESTDPTLNKVDDSYKPDEEVIHNSPIDMDMPFDGGDFLGFDEEMRKKCREMAERAGQPLDADDYMPANEYATKKYQEAQQALRTWHPHSQPGNDGNPPTYLKEVMNKLFATKIDWREKVQDFLTDKSPEDVIDVWAKRRMGLDPNHPFYKGRYLHPNEDLEERRSGIAQVFFLVDASGSMGVHCGDGKDIFEHIMSELIQIELAVKIKRSAYASFNCGPIHRDDITVWTYNDAQDEDSLFEQFERPVANGGTSAVEGIKSIQEYEDLYSTSDPWTLLVVVTDGGDYYTGLKDICKDAEQVEHMIWVITATGKAWFEHVEKDLMEQDVPQDHIIFVDINKEWGVDESMVKR